MDDLEEELERLRLAQAGLNEEAWELTLVWRGRITKPCPVPGCSEFIEQRSGARRCAAHYGGGLGRRAPKKCKAPGCDRLRHPGYGYSYCSEHAKSCPRCRRPTKRGRYCRVCNREYQRAWRARKARK